VHGRQRDVGLLCLSMLPRRPSRQRLRAGFPRARERAQKRGPHQPSSYRDTRETPYSASGWRLRERASHPRWTLTFSGRHLELKGPAQREDWRSFHLLVNPEMFRTKLTRVIGLCWNM
jgi:hypothetical protein